MCISTIVCYFLCDSETERPESILRERIGPGKKISDINTYLFWQKCSNSYWNDFSSKLKHIFQLGLGQNKKLLLSMFLFQIGTMYTFEIRQSKINSRLVAWPMRQMNRRPSVWCSKYHFFHDFLQNSLQKYFQSICLFF